MGQTRSEIVNKFPGQCVACGGRVPARCGIAFKDDDNKWKVRHNDGECGNVEIVVPKVEFAPTPEQVRALELFATGESMVIEAGAGTGKTSTLKLLAESTSKKVQYVAFNKAIVDEASLKFPKNVSCNTAHSLAYRTVGADYKHRMNGPRQKADQIARILSIDPIRVTVGGMEHRTLAAGALASRVMATIANFCKSADTEITRRHFPYIDGIDMPTADGRRTFANNDEIAARLLPVAKRAWADLNSKTGQLRFGHDHYLKIWQLQGPRINADVILFDEAQDANPVMAAIVEAQDHAQVVYVGDSQQAIYEFTGAVNTLANLDTDHRVFLTQSFRFGPALADVANAILGRLDAELRLVGTDSIPTEIGVCERENAILTRTNAEAVKIVLDLQGQGRRPFLVGGGADVVSFAEAARDLQESGHTSHPELSCFDSWTAVEQYVATDEGSDLKLLVKLVTTFGVETILRALDNMPTEARADVVVSTAHKAKGREWDSVRLGGDFPTGDDDKEVSVQEMRLLYVAVTRARRHLDISAIEAFFEDGAEDAIEDLDVDSPALRWVDGVEDDES